MNDIIVMLNAKSIVIPCKDAGNNARQMTAVIAVIITYQIIIILPFEV